MNSKILLFTAAVFMAANQLYAQCNPPSAITTLNVNNVNAKILNGGDLGWDLIGSPGYEVPKGAGTHALYAHAIWVGGFNDSNEVLVAGTRFRQNGFDFSPGPLKADGTPLDPSCNQWDRAFSVYQSEIDLFLGGNPPSPSIVNWPGKKSASDPNLAPFVDVNNDGLYNSADGDYPKIKGDQAIWYVINDAASVHTETGGRSIGIEVQVMAYAFQTNNEVNNATFYDYTITKKTPGNLNESYVGFFMDMDLGNAFDDYVACNSAKNIGIGFNGDNYDENSGSAIGYGQNPPAIALQFLKTPVNENWEEIGMSSFVYFNNDGSETGDPANDDHYYNYMRARWKDDTRITFGGNGYNLGDTNYVNYMYDMAGSRKWTECTAGNSPFDRRFVMSTGPTTLKQGEPIFVTTAIIYSEPITQRFRCDSLQDIVATADVVKNFYDGLVASVPNEKINNQQVEIYPNPSNGTVFLNTALIGAQYTVFNAQGALVYTGIINNSTEKLPQLPMGLYLLNVETEGKPINRKVVITR